ncbi:hypothetical protein K5Y32_22635 [Pantoea sp. DY-15]|uniref:hypothetical protein n=1 Tax=Pantoea sp. DY-15 TaxID=2871489 RepID=UPI001C956242|nr:hypothetical protein [Pantoea sp. DY-15]MBY4890727.1 hypothetical protein [Pantoea sp. DY-15]
MKLTIEPIPSSKRILFASGGTAIVWPLFNVENEATPCELFPDIEQIRDTHWLSSLPEHFKRSVILNPLLILLDKSVRNEAFQQNPHTELHKIVAELRGTGFDFPERYVDKTIRLVMNNMAIWRYQYGMLFPFISIAKALLSPDFSVVQSQNVFRKIIDADIPRFTSILALIALGILLKRDATVCDEKLTSALTQVQHFFRFTPNKSPYSGHVMMGEWLDRAIPLQTWLLVPMLAGMGYRFVGVPAVATTSQILHQVVFRAFASTIAAPGEPCQANLAFDITAFGGELMADVYAMMTQTRIRPKPDAAIVRQRLKTLCDIAASLSHDPLEKKAMRIAWEEWIEPGAGHLLQL